MRILAKFVSLFTKLFDFLSPLGDLAIRMWIFKSFFFAGLHKMQSWSTTVALFKDEYKVPFLEPEIAAWIGTLSEIILPILILIGLGARLPALAFFIFNIVTVISYPFLHTPEGACALKDHIFWGTLILVNLIHGPGKLSIDALLQRKCDEYRY